MSLDHDPSDLLPVVDDYRSNQCFVHPQTCRWSCGNQCAHPAPNESENEYFGAVAQRYVSRRRLLGFGALAAGMLVVGKTTVLGAETARAQSAGSGSGLNFTPVKLDGSDRIIVPPGYKSEILIRWGDPLFLDPGTGFEFGKQTAAQQERQFGYNCDFLGFIPLAKDRALLIANHEYTNPELMFPGYDPENPTKEQVDYELAAHGVSVVHIERHKTRGWRYTLGAWHNRRLTGTTPMRLTGPAAGHPWMRTSADPAGYTVLGTLNNCSAGITPWGTVLTCEENFNQYFANNDQVADAAKKAAHKRYGLPGGASERKWERFHKRFDLAQEPNEAFRFGWVVEFDPHDPGSLPRKHTALGRFKHEATSTVIAKDGRAVVYMGDDERFDYVYKFVSDGKYNPNDRQANFRLLESGTLYVAKFKDDGTGEWIPLIAGQGKLTAANGFATQGDVCIKTRLAADLVGATKMDRPEDIEVNPANGYVYAVMTNNSQRGTSGRPGTDAANPRAENRHGHIIEMMPAGGDHAALKFQWRFLMLCGDPAKDKGTYFGGFDQSLVSPISSPDNITFDRRGNLWIATDGQTSTFKKNDGVFAVPVAGPERGYNRQFLSGVPGGECASLVFSDTDDTLFVSIQHPGEGSTLEKLSSNFPDGKEPRPTVIFVMKEDGGVIGS
ncbi:MAG: phosphatase [Tepidiforma sp.]|nr:PhoX family phosphatase [Tepidiforma sp.]GIW19463.1 MAG: phosphatase [Tepidiforma sp.]